MQGRNLLRDLIGETGLRQDYIARELDISQAALSRKLDGLRSFTESEVARLQALLGIDNSRLMRRILPAAIRQARKEKA